MVGTLRFAQPKQRAFSTQRNAAADSACTQDRSKRNPLGLAASDALGSRTADPETHKTRPPGENEPMKSPICDMLGIEFPLLAFSHCRDVVAAVSRAGGFGVLGATAHSPDTIEQELKWIDEHVDGKPHG